MTNNGKMKERMMISPTIRKIWSRIWPFLEISKKQTFAQEDFVRQMKPQNSVHIFLAISTMAYQKPIVMMLLANSSWVVLIRIDLGSSWPLLKLQLLLSHIFLLFFSRFTKNAVPKKKNKSRRTKKPERREENSKFHLEEMDQLLNLNSINNTRKTPRTSK